MSGESVEKPNFNNAQFVPDEEETQETKYDSAEFIADDKQPNLINADIPSIEKSENTGSIMGTLSDIITNYVQQENRLTRARGEITIGAAEGAAEVIATQPADIVAGTLQVVGDLTDSKGIRAFGDEMENTSKDLNEFIEKDWIVRDDPTIDPKIRHISRALGNGSTQVLQMQGIAKNIGGGLTYALYTVPDASETYLGYREGGYSKEESLAGGAAVGVGFYAIDRFFDGAKLIKGMKNTAGGLLDMLLEPAAEMSQEGYKNMVMKIGPDKTRDLMTGVIESGIGGLAGGISGSFSVSINGTEYSPNTRYNDAKQAALDAGATEEEINGIISDMYTAIDNHPEIASKYLTDIVDKNTATVADMIRNMPTSIAYQNVNTFYKTADEFIKKNEGTPEAEKVAKTKSELDNVYKDTYAALENLMPSQEADANSKLVQGHALFASREFGISPKAYMDNMFAKVEQGRSDLFLGDASYQIAGEKARTSRLDALEEAKRMLSDKTEKYTRDQIYDKTKWYLGSDGRWRYEIKDTKAIINKETILNSFLGLDVEEKLRETIGEKEKLVDEYNSMSKEERVKLLPRLAALDKHIEKLMKKPVGKRNLKLKDILKFDELYEAYPELKDIDVVLKESGAKSSWVAAYEPTNRVIEIYKKNFLNQTIEGVKKTIVHEIQHAVQEIEGFAEGGTAEYAIQKLTEKVNRVKYSSEMSKYDETIHEYSMYNDIANVMAVSENPNKVAKTGWYYFNVSYAPNKGTKAWKEHIKETAEIFLREMEYKYKEFPYEYEKYIDLLMNKSYSEIMSKKKSLHDRAKRQLEKVDFKGMDKAKKILNEYHSGLITDDDLYREIYGENEAFAVGDRSSYTEEELEKVRPYESMFIPEEDAIIIIGDRAFPAASKKDNIYMQPAFAGSRVDYDRPSLEAIGTGEGAQAHGYGLYYALSKDVAESYREKFIKEEYKTNWEISGIPLKEFVGELYNSDTSDIFGTVENKIQTRSKTQARENLLIALSDVEHFYREQYKEGHKSLFGNRKEIYHNPKDLEMAELAAQKRQDVSTYSWSDFKEAVGQVHEVDIPEMPELIDEQKTFDEQSDFVKDKIKSLNNEAINDIIEGNSAGDDIYGELVNDINKKTGYKLEQMEAEKRASETLRAVGIKGITYFGQQDGRCFVIFNPDDVKVVQKFYQGETGKQPRGAYYQGIIHLFENADPSTFIHESMHFYKQELEKLKDTSTKAKQILETLENFSATEFDKRYVVESKEGGYIVADKNGRTIYDKRGDKFATEEEAREYGKNEIISRGFEQYMREGKSPSKYLTRAFHSFMNWLKHIYNSAKQLGVELNDEVRKAYGELLGGEDLDYWMSQPTEEIANQTQSVEKDKKQEIDDIIAEAVANKNSKTREPKGKGFRDIWTKAMIPLSTRAKRVSPYLQTRLRRFEFELATSMNKKYEQSRPFMEIWKDMSEDDAIAFDLALKNDYVEKQQEIIKKYNAEQEWAKIQETLADIYSEATNVGIELGYRENYFPRKVKDVDGLLAYFKNLEEWTRYERALKDADPDNVFTAEEQAEFLNKYMRGFVKVDLMPYKYGSEKERRVSVVNNEINQFYASSLDSYISYIEGMNSRIVSSKFLGKDAANYEESVGGYLTYLLDNDLIKPNQVDEVRSILRARFGQRGVSNRFLSTARDLSYIYTMGGINSAITQIEDLSVSMYKAGVWNTLTTMFSGKEITRKDIGVENISQEFSSQKKTSKWLNGLFKATGLDAIDSFGKETLINAVIKKYKDIYAKDPMALREYLEPIMEEQTGSVIEDIVSGNKSDNLMYLVFSELSDVQPVSLSELPEFYNTSGNLRVLYMLKSFMIKRIDTFRNECFDKLRSKDVSDRIDGVKNLLSMSILMMLCGATKDWIIDLLYGRKTNLPEVMVNNLMGLFGITKFHLYKAREQGFTGVIKEFAVPPIFSFFDDLIGDVYNVAEGKRKVKDMEVLKGIPLFGRFYYWWIGRGSEKSKKKRKR